MRVFVTSNITWPNALTAVRFVCGGLLKGAALYPPSEWGKKKTLLQMIALLLYGVGTISSFGSVWNFLGQAMLVAATGLTMYSLFKYIDSTSPMSMGLSK